MDLRVSATPRVGLLGGMECGVGDRGVELPLGAQRLIALLALSQRGVHRSVAAEQLWPDRSGRRAAANLRSALWAGRRVEGLTVIACAGARLLLDPAVRVDLHDSMSDLEPVPAAHVLAEPSTVVERLKAELLPGWSEDWLEYERQRWDQSRMHGLEAIASKLLDEKRYLPAMQAALAAVGIEPIRETAHRIVIAIHLAEGNEASALRHHHRYRRMLAQELGASPSRQMEELIGRATSR